MNMKSIRCIIICIICMFGSAGCAVSTDNFNSEEIKAEESLQTNGDVSNTGEYNNMRTEENRRWEEISAIDEYKKDNGSDEGLETSGDMELTYKMELYTKAQNENSSIKIQYPFFSGDKEEEINKIIKDKVEDIAFLDPAYFPENPKMIANYQSDVTLQNSKIISIVFWGTSDIEVSAFPTTNLYTLNIDLELLKTIALNDLYTVNEEFEKVFFEKAFFPSDPITSYSEETFAEMLKLQTPEYTSISPFSTLKSIKFFLKLMELFLVCLLYMHRAATISKQSFYIATYRNTICLIAITGKNNYIHIKV